MRKSKSCYGSTAPICRRTRRFSTVSIPVETKLPTVDETMATVDPIFARLVAEQHFKGAALAVVAGDQVAYKQYGALLRGLLRATDEASINMTFEIGSITKALTGLALASLVESGKVRWDSTLGEFLPEVKTNPAIARITLAQLASHSSGLPPLPNDLLGRNTQDNPYAKYTINDVIQNLKKLDDLEAPGQKYEYSNFGFGVLGLALIRASGGATLDHLLKKHVFDPLAMGATSTTHRLTTVGHNESLEEVPGWTFDGLQAAGALRSTPSDMIKLLQAMVNPASSPMSAAIEAATKKIIETPRGVASGWHVGLAGHPEVIWHNGATGGYSSLIAVHPPTRRGLVLLNNNASEMSTRAGNFVLSSLLGQPSELAIHDYYHEEIPFELLQLLPDSYRHGNVRIAVKLRNGQVWFKFPSFPATRGYPETPFRFHVRSLGVVIDFDGWSPGLPPHTLTYTQGETKIETTREDQEFRKFLGNTKQRILRMFGAGGAD